MTYVSVSLANEGRGKPKVPIFSWTNQNYRKKMIITATGATSLHSSRVKGTGYERDIFPSHFFYLQVQYFYKFEID